MTTDVRLVVKSGASLLAKRFLASTIATRTQTAWRFGEDEIRGWQERRFRRLYQHAVTRIPYYACRRADYPLFADRMPMREVLSRLPILSKQEVRQHNDAFWASPRGLCVTTHATSGTSGTPLRIAASARERAFQLRLLEDWYQRICGTRTPRTAYLSGFVVPRPGREAIAWREALTGDVYLSIYSLCAANRSTFLRLLRSVRPQLLYGYASALHELARLLEDSETSWLDSCVAVSTSEVLPEDWRRRLSRTICSRVYDMYSSQEGAHLVLECSAGQMHVHPMVGIVEVLDEKEVPARAGEPGRVVVTGLVKKSMPLLRYDLGDSAVAGDAAAPCSCGLKWPTIGRVEGRQEDLVKTRDGRRIGYLCFHATKNLVGIREAQLVQQGYERFTVNLVLDESRTPTRESVEGHIKSQIEARLGYKPTLNFSYPETIPAGARGKRRAVVVEDFGDD